MDELLKSYSEELIVHLSNVMKVGAKEYRIFDFNSSFFKKYDLDKIRDSEVHVACEKKLRSLKGPVIYWFEILSDNKNSEIVNVIRTYKNKNKKAVPALRKSYDIDSKCLYVGKVKNYFWSRVIQHLGYYNEPRTQGLQLFHWADNIDLSLRLHAYEFEKGTENLMGIFELKLAKELKPIIGRHS